MEWIIENWYLIIIAIATLVIAGFTVYGFIRTPSNEQLEKVQEWLLQAVIAAEKELGEKTGQAKLSMTYDLFVSRFPAIAKVLSFNTFKALVDSALEKMRNMLASNKNLQEYVYGKSEVDNND